MNFSIERDLKSQLSLVRKCCSIFCKRVDERSLLESEVLERIWRKKHQFEGNENDFKGWVMIITRNLYIDNYKKNKRYTLYNLDLADQYKSTNHDAASKLELDDVLFTINTKFKKHQSEIFRLHVIEGYKIDEVAEKLNVPDGTVKSTIHYIRKYISKPENILAA